MNQVNTVKAVNCQGSRRPDSGVLVQVSKSMPRAAENVACGKVRALRVEHRDNLQVLLPSLDVPEAQLVLSLTLCFELACNHECDKLAMTQRRSHVG